MRRKDSKGREFDGWAVGRPSAHDDEFIVFFETLRDTRKESIAAECAAWGKPWPFLRREYELKCVKVRLEVVDEIHS